MLILLFLCFLVEDGGQINQARLLADQMFVQTKSTTGLVWSEGVVQESPSGYHVRYKRSFQGVPILDKVPRRVVLSKNLKKVPFKQDETQVERFPGFRRLSSRQIEQALKQHQHLYQKDQTSKTAFDWVVTGQSRYYLVERQRTLAVVRLEVERSDSSHTRYWLDLNAQTGLMIQRFNRNLTFQEEGLGTVWRHNPIAAASDVSQVGSKLVRVPLRGLDGSGYLRGPYVDVTSPELYWPQPDWASRHWLNYRPGAAFEPSLEFHYDPSDPRFEEVSVYYWMDRAQRYLQAQGQNLRQQPIQAFVHYSAETNAAYFTASNSIYFGDGLIDTAEDADVICHEYGHAVLDAACGERLYDNYGSMFHEGFADFFSYLISQDASAEVGPDRFPDFLGEWIGRFHQADPSYLRTLNPPNFRYPYLNYEPHADGALWSSLFYQLALTIGSDKTAQILFEALYRLDSAAPEDVVSALYSAEGDLYAGAYHELLKKLLRERGLVETESTTPIQTIGLGQTQVSLAPGKTQYFRFEAPQAGADLEILLQNESSLTDLTAYLSKNYLPDEYRNDSLLDSYFTPGFSGWTLRADGLSQPTLEAGVTYYLAVKSYLPSVLNISLENTVADPIPVWSEPETQVALQDYAIASFRVQNLGQKSRLVLDADPTNSIVLVLLSSQKPVDLRAAVDGFVLGGYLGPSETGVFDLADFPNEDELFLTIQEMDGSPQNLTFTLAAVASDRDHPPLQLGVPQPSLLGKTYQNLWQLDLDHEAQSLVFQTDATHPFTVTPPDQPIWWTANASIQNGIYTLVATPNQWRTVGFNFHHNLSAGIVTAGEYLVQVSGPAGDPVEVSVREEVLPVAAFPAQGVDQVLAPAELAKFQFDLAEGYEDFLFEALDLDDQASFRIFMFPVAASSVNRLAWEGQLDTTQPFFRINGEPQNFEESLPLFVPGERYEVWFYNETNNPQRLKATLSFGQLDPVETLVDGTEVHIPRSGPDYLFGSIDYSVPYWVVPPPGTKRVRLCLDHFSGTRIVEAMVQGADERLQYSPLYEVQFGETELRFEPNQPFKLYFSGGWQAVPMEGDARFRVFLEFLDDGPHRAILSPDQLRVTGHSISNRDWATQLVVPERTRQIDLAWLATEKPLDTKLFLLGDQGLALPVDLAPFQDVLSEGNQKAYRLNAKTALGSMEPVDWTLDLYHDGDPAYMPGFFVEQSPFVFDWVVRYRDLKASYTLVAAEAIGGQAALTSTVRIANPNATEVSLNLSNGEIAEPVRTLAPGGFISLTMVPGSRLTMTADQPLLVFSSESGTGWSTLASAPAFAEDRVYLPHVSPDQSAWSSYINYQQTGATATLLVGPDGAEVEPPALGTALSNPDSLASWRFLQTGVPDGEVFRETSLSVTQYWQNANQVVAEIPTSRGSRTLYVPHLPNNPAWWSGVTLSNPGSRAATVSVRVYNQAGPVPETTHFELAAGATEVGLLSRYLPETLDDHAASWMRIDSTEELIGLEFMGGIHTGDSAGFLLPGVGSSELFLPGNLAPGEHGFAITNTVAVAGQATVDALASDGSILASQTYDFQAFERKLFTASQWPLDVGASFQFRVRTKELSLTGLQLDVSNTGQLSATAATPVQLPAVVQKQGGLSSK